MIVEQFIQWVTTTTPEKRAKATNALARAYLVSDLSDYDRDAAEAAMTFLLDDPSSAVRLALADVLSGEQNAPRHIIIGLLDDLPEIGAVVAARSPILIDSELVDIVATRELPFQLAVAGRMPLSAAVSAAIAEVTSIDVCLRLLANPNALILPRTLLRLAERFGADQEMQHRLLARDPLPISARQLLLAEISDALCDEAIRSAAINPARAGDVSREARDRATLTLVRNARDGDMTELIEHLRETGQMTTVLLLRAICAGQILFFVEALADLSGVSRARILALLNDRSRRGLKSVYVRAGLPEEAYPAFAIAFDVYVEEGEVVDVKDQYRFTRIMIERILERYKSVSSQDMDGLLAMLRRFASETARDAARNYVQHQIAAA